MLVLLLFRFGRGSQHHNRASFRNPRDDASYVILIEFDVYPEETCGVLADILPELLVVNGIAIAIVGSAPWRSQQLFDLR